MGARADLPAQLVRPAPLRSLLRSACSIALRSALTEPHARRRRTLPNLSNHTLHGQVKFTLRELYRTPIKAITRPLIRKPKRGQTSATAPTSDPGQLVARVVEVGDTSGYVECAARAHNLAVTGVARDKCSPFLVVSRYCNMAGTWEVIHRSVKATTNELDPLWPRFEASLHRVCANDRDTYLRMEVWNDEANGQHLLLGQAETSVAGILSHPFNASNTATDSSGGGGGRAAEHGKVHLELSTGSSGQPAAHVQPKRNKAGSMRMPQNKAVATIEMIVHSGAGAGGNAGFDATVQFDAIADAASAAGLGSDGQPPQSTDAASNGNGGRRRRRRQVEQPSYRQDDMAFLQDLMMDDVVRESDVKDIVGDGLRFLNELSTETEAEALAQLSQNGPKGGADTEAKRKRRQAQRRKIAKGQGGAPAARDMGYSVQRAGAADPERGIGQFLEPKLARDPQVTLKVRKQKRLGLRRSIGGQPSIGGRAAQKYDRTDSVLARARAFVGEDGDESSDQMDDRDGVSEPPPRHPPRRVVGKGISSRLYPAQEPDETSIGVGDIRSPGGDGSHPHRPLSLPALHIGEAGPEDTPGLRTGKVKGPRWREQAKGGKNLRLNVTRKFKALTAPVFDEIE